MTADSALSSTRVMVASQARRGLQGGADQSAALGVEEAGEEQATGLTRTEAQTAEVHLVRCVSDTGRGIHGVPRVVALLAEAGHVQALRLVQEMALLERR
jgi:hypothetical protein